MSFTQEMHVSIPNPQDYRTVHELLEDTPLENTPLDAILRDATLRAQEQQIAALAGASSRAHANYGEMRKIYEEIDAILTEAGYPVDGGYASADWRNVRGRLKQALAQTSR